MKLIRTKDGIYELMPNIEQDYTMSFDGETLEPAYYTINHEWVAKKDVNKQADTIEELLDEIVLIENGNEHDIVYLQEAYDRIDEYHEQGNYEPRLIGRIKAGLDKKAVAEWKENKQGLYDWVLL